ncbi:replication initiation protein RepC [Faunimonas pinastri]|uniref:Replication initiation protein RepC n=2 Tax=Faunimonas pinastri TaxID=1855383 RepID=A0A1H9MZW2_9HYPH|nr:replication initiation protein RepC [Faunimonas pinastri]
MQTVPSGGRRLTPAVLAGRELAFEKERTVSRKELAQTAREAEKALSLRPGLRLVLHELVGSWGEQDFEGKLLVWPSNDYLVARTGLSERTVRYAVSQLVELQLVSSKDSANGKRFAIRDRAGEIVDAFGFDLTPLYARRGEFTAEIERQKLARDAQGRLFDQITICRRATEEALSALAEHFPGVVTADLIEALDELRERTPRRGSMRPIERLVGEWLEIRRLAEKRYYESANGGNSCRHKETNNDSPSESCTKVDEGVGSAERPVSLTLGLVLDACPALSMYPRPIRSENDLIDAGKHLRSMLSAHPSAWREAVEAIGPVRAAGAVALVLQLYEDDQAAGTNRIRNPGGYFRAMVRMVAEGRVDLQTEIIALRKRRLC